jgi:hypothetical protein
LTMALRRSKEEERSVWMEIADEGIDHGSHTSARHAFTCVLVNLLLTCWNYFIQPKLFSHPWHSIPTFQTHVPISFLHFSIPVFSHFTHPPFMRFLRFLCFAFLRSKQAMMFNESPLPSNPHPEYTHPPPMPRWSYLVSTKLCLSSMFKEQSSTHIISCSPSPRIRSLPSNPNPTPTPTPDATLILL